MNTKSKLSELLDLYVEAVNKATMPALVIASTRGMGLTDAATAPVRAADARLRTHAAALEAAARGVVTLWGDNDSALRALLHEDLDEVLDAPKILERYRLLREALAALDA